MLVVVALTFGVLTMAASRSSAGPAGVTKELVAFEIITLVAGSVFCYLITRHVTGPVFRLRAAAGRIAQGHLDTRVDAALEHRRDALGDLGRDFNRMAERIEMLVDGQRRLLGDVSHELRSPLSRLIVALGLVKQRPQEASEHLERIALESRRLDALIGQLLTLSRINSGTYTGARAPVDLTNLVDEIASDGDFEARAHGRTVTVVHADACSLDGFEEILRSAIENVVRNAVRHTRQGTSVEIRLSEQPSAGGRKAVLRIRDHGPGVAESSLSEMFLPFRRVAPPTAGSAEGTGLGLAITDRAVTLHGGTVHAENAADGGLIVNIELPL